MTRAAEVFCIESGEEFEIRFDLISLVLEDKVPEIVHIEDAFFSVLRSFEKN